MENRLLSFALICFTLCLLFISCAAPSAISEGASSYEQSQNGNEINEPVSLIGNV